MTAIFNWLVDQAANRLFPTVRFETLNIEGQYSGLPPVSVSCPPRETVTEAAAPHATVPPPDDGGRGHHVADDCTYTNVEKHFCTNSYGDPILPGQSCYASARRESLRSFVKQHPRFNYLLEERDRGI